MAWQLAAWGADTSRSLAENVFAQKVLQPFSEVTASGTKSTRGQAAVARRRVCSALEQWGVTHTPKHGAEVEGIPGAHAVATLPRQHIVLMLASPAAATSSGKDAGGARVRRLVLDGEPDYLTTCPNHQVVWAT